MERPVFDFESYKSYLNELCGLRPRGFRKALAEAAQCQTAYVSHVLNGPGHFNLEQAEAAARFLSFGREETRYWLILVEHGRAGTVRLREVLGDQLAEMRERSRQLKQKVGIQTTLSREFQATYYSSWHFAAVHMAATVPALRTRDAMAKALRMRPRKLASVLEFLVSAGLLERRGGEYVPGTTQLHLERDSPLIYRHHANWRAQALESLEADPDSADVHYSSVVTLSAEDVEKVREMITRNLRGWIDVIKESKEERIYGLGLDFFRVDQA